jgi:hypothetical protein
MMGHPFPASLMLACHGEQQWRALFHWLCCGLFGLGKGRQQGPSYARQLGNPHPARTGSPRRRLPCSDHLGRLQDKSSSYCKPGACCRWRISGMRCTTKGGRSLWRRWEATSAAHWQLCYTDSGHGKTPGNSRRVGAPRRPTCRSQASHL